MQADVATSAPTNPPPITTTGAPGSRPWPTARSAARRRGGEGCARARRALGKPRRARARPGRDDQRVAREDPPDAERAPRDRRGRATPPPRRGAGRRPAAATRSAVARVGPLERPVAAQDLLGQRRPVVGGVGLVADQRDRARRSPRGAATRTGATRRGPRPPRRRDRDAEASVTGRRAPATRAASIGASTGLAARTSSSVADSAAESVVPGAHAQRAVVTGAPRRSRASWHSAAASAAGQVGASAALDEQRVAAAAAGPSHRAHWLPAVWPGCATSGDLGADGAGRRRPVVGGEDHGASPVTCATHGDLVALDVHGTRSWARQAARRRRRRACRVGAAGVVGVEVGQPRRGDARPSACKPVDELAAARAPGRPGPRPRLAVADARRTKLRISRAKASLRREVAPGEQRAEVRRRSLSSPAEPGAAPTPRPGPWSARRASSASMIAVARSSLAKRSSTETSPSSKDATMASSSSAAAFHSADRAHVASSLRRPSRRNDPSDTRTTPRRRAPRRATERTSAAAARRDRPALGQAPLPGRRRSRRRRRAPSEPDASASGCRACR